jgi:hypothetical protein
MRRQPEVLIGRAVSERLSASTGSWLSSESALFMWIPLNRIRDGPFPKITLKDDSLREDGLRGSVLRSREGQ